MQTLQYQDIKHIATRAAIRHWQRVGLLPDVRDKNGILGYRVFDGSLLPKIEEIARLRRAGLSCAGIGRYFQKMEKLQDVPAEKTQTSNTAGDHS